MRRREYCGRLLRTPWAVPSNDLVLDRLLAAAVAVPEHPSSIEPSTFQGSSSLALAPPSSFRHALKRDGSRARTSLLGSIADLSDVIPGGTSAILNLHFNPAREVNLANGNVVLLGSNRADDDVVVLLARWDVERLPNKMPRDAELLEQDYFNSIFDVVRLENLLAACALDVRFEPEHPLLRVAAVITGDLAGSLTGIGGRLQAAAAVRCGQLDLFVPTHDVRDAKQHRRFEQAVLSNRYALLVTLSRPGDKWVWNLGRKFRENGREHRALPASGVDDACEELTSVLSVVCKALPARPTRYWGADALKRIDSRVGRAFALTDRARSHLERNRYPDPERMLQHLEMLVECAEMWSEPTTRWSDGTRLEDWARANMKLNLALHDSGIKESDAYFHFQGVRLCNRPHVKVDDGTSPGECGRSYNKKLWMLDLLKGATYPPSW